MKRLEVRPAFVALVCLLFYISPLRVFLPFLTMALLHELGHLAALAMLGVEVKRIRLGALGTTIETGALPPVQEIVCALAGPAVNLLCFWALKERFFGAALFSLLFGCYNLLPVYPLDGGRALRALLCLWLPARVATGIEIAVAIVLLSGIGLAAIRLKYTLGLLPLWLFGSLLGHLCLEEALLK